MLCGSALCLEWNLLMILLEEEINTAGHYRLIKKEIVGALSWIEEDQERRKHKKRKTIEIGKAPEGKGKLYKRLPSNQYTPYRASLNNNINNNKIFLHLGVGGTLYSTE
jgi:hypothetical protein